jgi:hypothetical protein
MRGLSLPAAMLLGALFLSGCSAGDSPALAPFRTDVFDRAFNNATLPSVEGSPYELHTETLGELDVPTGRIGALEAFFAHDFQPFTVEVPPGRYTTQVAVAATGNDEIVAFARVKFSNARVAYWKMAVWPHTDTSDLEAGAFVGYAVDGGTGSFMDATAAEDIAGPEQGRGLFAGMEREIEKPRRMRAMFRTARSNVAVFSTGNGDGAYPSYFGFGESGEPVVLVTDFGLFPWQPDPEPPPP